MLYQYSQATSDGVMTLTVTFKLGTDVDKAQVQVQNRVGAGDCRSCRRRCSASASRPTSPRPTSRWRCSSTRRTVATIRPISSNFVALHIKDELARLDGVGDVQRFGGGDYSMRVWLDPEKVAARGLTAGDVVSAIREQNVQVAAGQLGAPPGRRTRAEFPARDQHQGPPGRRERISRTSSSRPASAGQIVRLRDVARVELGSDNYALRAMLDNRTAVAIPIFQRPGSNAIAISDAVRAKMAELKKSFPEGIDYNVAYDPTVFVRGSIKAVLHTLLEAIAAGRDRRDRVPADLARLDHSADRRAGLADRHVRRHAPVRLRTERAVAVRAGAGDRHRGRRRDRRRRECRAQHHERSCARSTPPARP